MILRTEKVNMDSAVKAITIFASLLISVLGIGMPIYFIIISESNTEIIINVFIILFILICTVPFFLMAPKRLILSDDSLILKKGYGRLILPLNEINDIDLFESDSLGIRTLGSGGFLGYLGKFYSKKLGHYTAYVRNCSESFFVTMKNGKKYLLSCNNHREMVEQIKKLINH